MARKSVYDSRYRQSWALVIGINEYQFTGELDYARNDAEAVANLLRERLGFPEENVKLLIDTAATRDAIRTHFLRFAKEDVTENDRIIIFFAGHGITRSSHRGEVGYLVPVDGQIDELSTLIRWDELTRDADFIAAKHLFFVIDACFGGLALSRGLQVGSSRFVKDMLSRFSRQVLASGKGDETVADGNGPRDGHSIFTGHFLDSLESPSISSDGVLTASTVMASVYEKVAKDQYSRQSPHSGHFDGDGDMILILPEQRSEDADGGKDIDILVEVPHVMILDNQTPTLVTRMKEYLSDPHCRIPLDDLVVSQLRKFHHDLRDKAFAINASDFSGQALAERLRNYERCASNILTTGILLGRWALPEQVPILARMASRLTDNIEFQGGNVAWLGLRWYPVMLLLYSAGIAAVSSENYSALAGLFLAPTSMEPTDRLGRGALCDTVENILDVTRTDFFKRLPGHERNYHPLNEYLHKALQPLVDDLLCAGKSYDNIFDRFEILYALSFAEISSRGNNHIWGPPGRFAWKHIERGNSSPFDALLNEAHSMGNSWGPIKAGLFGRSIDRFEEVALSYRARLLKSSSWS